MAAVGDGLGNGFGAFAPRPIVESVQSDLEADVSRKGLDAIHASFGAKCRNVERILGNTSDVGAEWHHHRDPQIGRFFGVNAKGQQGQQQVDGRFFPREV